MKKLILLLIVIMVAVGCVWEGRNFWTFGKKSPTIVKYALQWGFIDHFACNYDGEKLVERKIFTSRVTWFNDRDHVNESLSRVPQHTYYVWRCELVEKKNRPNPGKSVVYYPEFNKPVEAK